MTHSLHAHSDGKTVDGQYTSYAAESVRDSLQLRRYLRNRHYFAEAASTSGRQCDGGVTNHWTEVDWTHENVRNKLINHRK